MPSGLNGLLELSTLLESVTLMVIGHYRKGIQTEIRQDKSRRPGKVQNPKPLPLFPKESEHAASRTTEGWCQPRRGPRIFMCKALLWLHCVGVVDWFITWLTDCLHGWLIWLHGWFFFFFKFPGWPISHDLKLSPYINIVDLSCVASPPLGLEGVASSTLNKDISVTYDVDYFPEAESKDEPSL